MQIHQVEDLDPDQLSFLGWAGRSLLSEKEERSIPRLPRQLDLHRKQVCFSRQQLRRIGPHSREDDNQHKNHAP